MTSTDEVALGDARTAYRKRAWARCRDVLRAVDRAAPLDPEHLEQLATAAYLTGEDQLSDDSWVRAHHAWLDRDEPARAAGCAFWLGLGLVTRGDMAQGGGWLGRAHRLVEPLPEPTVVHGLLLVAGGLQQLGQGDPAAARGMFEQAEALGSRLRHPDLLAMALLGQGQAHIDDGDPAGGVALLDEAMVGVTAGEVSPVTGGIVYCAVIEACQKALDLGRAREWTEALTRWCADQPELVHFRGHCLVYRAEVLQHAGAWGEALTEARRACQRLSEPRVHPALGLACYRLGELLRLTGQLDEADASYRRAQEFGQQTQPGVALLLRDRGDLSGARSSLRAALAGIADPVARLPLLAASVEVAVQDDAVTEARTAADELSRLHDDLAAGSELLAVLVPQAEGTVLLAEGDAAAALPLLRRAVDGWLQLQAPYDAARARLLLARAYEGLGDATTAELERDAAMTALRALGAESRPEDRPAISPWHLTDREHEVLVLVAQGRTNREVAESLSISEHTARRHVQNICGKLEVSSRTAAAALAIREGLA